MAPALVQLHGRMQYIGAGQQPGAKKVATGQEESPPGVDDV